jgi:hypothetical protein
VDRSGLRRHPPFKLTTDYVDRHRGSVQLARPPAPSTATCRPCTRCWPGERPSRQHVTVMPEFSWQDEDEGRIRYLSPDEETAADRHPARSRVRRGG